MFGKDPGEVEEPAKEAETVVKTVPGTTREPSVPLTPAQLSMLPEGIDWRMPVRTHCPELAA